MFSNTFQAILLLVTFTIRRGKNLPLKINTGNRAAQTSVIGHLQSIQRPLWWVQGCLCSLKKWPLIQLKVILPLQRSPECSGGCQCYWCVKPEPLSSVFMSPLSMLIDAAERQKGPCLHLLGSRSGSMLRVLVLEKHLPSILDEVER